jgi:hypothetical protein
VDGIYARMKSCGEERVRRRLVRPCGPTVWTLWIGCVASAVEVEILGTVGLEGIVLAWDPGPR